MAGQALIDHLRAELEHQYVPLPERLQKLRDAMKARVDQVQGQWQALAALVQQQWWSNQVALVELLNHFQQMSEWYLPLIKQATNVIANDPLRIPVQKNTEYVRYYQMAVDKLNYEYLYLVGLVSSVMMPDIQEVDEALAGLPLLVSEAKKSFGLEEFTIITHPGISPYLNVFYYAPKIAALSIPLELLRCPWKWSLFWHELAGILLVPDDGSPGVINEKRRRIGSSIAGLADGLLRSGIPDIKAFAKRVLENGSGQVKLSDENLKALLEGWLEELVEDGLTLLVLGGAGFESLTDMLQREYNSLTAVEDDRHPPALLRLETAYRLLVSTAAGTHPGMLAQLEAQLNTIRMLVPEVDLIPVIEAIAARIVDSLRGLFLGNGLGAPLIAPDYLWVNAPFHEYRARAVVEGAINAIEQFRAGAQQVVSLSDVQANALQLLSQAGEVDAAIMDFNRLKSMIANAHSTQFNNETLRKVNKLRPGEATDPKALILNFTLGKVDPWKKRKIRHPFFWGQYWRIPW